MGHSTGGSWLMGTLGIVALIVGVIVQKGYA